MEIRYLGHSSFMLTADSGTAIVTDPYAPEVGFKMPEVSADAVTVSHHHFDHDYVRAVGGNPQIIDRAENRTIDGVEITAVKSFHDPVGGKLRGENVIFKFLIDGVKVCHLGDLGEACSEELVRKIAPVDVLLIPVGGNYTIDAKSAETYVKRLKPKIVIPMHYRVSGLNVDIAEIENFTRLFNRGEVEELAASETEITKSNLTEDKTRIIVLRRA